ncbi:UNVERIFIED_CONTAM: hypothetical protein GTU68_063894 [Idotea baltica]|nr:hypothetical protein [Idotea baltica]
MGSGSRESDAHQVPNERGSTSPLSRYTRKHLSLKVPKTDKHIQYFGIWSPTKGMITSVNFPHEMRIPPSL